MNLKWLEAFKAIMMTGTVTAAADFLHITQPAVSRMIASLEAELGFKLFMRERSRLFPTPEGDRLFHDVERALTSVSGVLTAAKDIRSNKGAVLKVVAMSTLADAIVPQALKAFLAKHPHVAVTFEIRNRREIEQWVADQQFDLGLAALPVEHPSIESRSFVRVQAEVLLPKEHALATQAEVSPQDLGGQPFIAMPAHTMLRRSIDKWLVQGDAVTGRRIEAASLRSASHMAGEGLGLTIADPFTIASLRDPRLVSRRLRPALNLSYGFLTPVGRPLSIPAKQFAESVRQTASDILRAHRSRS